MVAMRTYKFKLEPTRAQKEKIDWTIQMCRNLYNAALEQRIFAYKKRGVSLNWFIQKKELPRLKGDIQEFTSIHSQVLQDVLKRLDKAFEAFFSRVRRGENPGFPRFQGKNRYDSFTYPQSGYSIMGTFLRLSKIGDVRIKCHRKMEGKVKTCCVIRKNGKYYACFSCEVEAIEKDTSLPTKGVGVDLGTTHLAITSDGVFFDNPKYLRKSEKQLKRLQRIVSRRKKGSNRRRKAVHLLAKKHESIANQRKDTAHKVSRKLVNEHDLIAFEDLNIQGMVKNHHLAKSIVDSAWHQLIQFTSYKAEWAGKNVIKVNPYNTSQMCSSCSLIVKKSLSQRTHTCSCGYTAHRDVNAARNILRIALRYEHSEWNA